MEACNSCEKTFRFTRPLNTLQFNQPLYIDSITFLPNGKDFEPPTIIRPANKRDVESFCTHSDSNGVELSLSAASGFGIHSSGEFFVAQSQHHYYFNPCGKLNSTVFTNPVNDCSNSSICQVKVFNKTIVYSMGDYKSGYWANSGPDSILVLNATTGLCGSESVFRSTIIRMYCSPTYFLTYEYESASFCTYVFSFYLPCSNYTTRLTKGKFVYSMFLFN